MDVLIHISQQLNDSTTPAYAPIEFAVSPSIAAINVLFFLSLALVLIDAFLAMLVKSWLQEFERGWRKHITPNLRAQEREQRLQGLERWKLAQLVALLPILIQISLLIFCIGLLVLLFPIHLISAILSSLALMVGVAFYVFTTFVSILDTHAPFSSPVSRGLIILRDALRMTWSNITSHFLLHAPRLLSHISRLLPSREHEANTDTSIPSLHGKSGAAHPSLPQGNKAVEKREAEPRSDSQIDPQTHFNIVERLVTAAIVLENVPVLLELLDQPVKFRTLRPSNIKEWGILVGTTVRLLRDQPTFSRSVACTITRSVPFWYHGRPADLELSQRLIKHFTPGQTDQHESLDSLFASYLSYCCGVSSAGPVTVNSTIPPVPVLCSTIASLEPSDVADTELLWMVNTIHKNWLRESSQDHVYSLSLELFTAVLIYISSTEQSGQSQKLLIGAIIYAMHTIKSALGTGGTFPVEEPYALPGSGLPNSKSEALTFHKIDALDLWSGRCCELAKDLLEPYGRWSGPGVDAVSEFQLALITALYIASTKQAEQAEQASTVFKKLLNDTDIQDTIIMSNWWWADVYDKTKLAGCQYMALFKQPLCEEFPVNSPFQDIGYIIMQIIKHCSKTTLSVLHLLDFSVQHLHKTTSTSLDLLSRDAKDALQLVWTARDSPGSPVRHSASGSFDPWLLLHLQTLFSQNSILKPDELELLKWCDDPEQMHIAEARLALYDSWQAEEQKRVNQLKLDLPVLNLCLKSSNYAVCTGAFKWYLNLATTTPAGYIQSARMFTQETMGHEWIKHLVQVLCGDSVPESRPWKFLAEHLAPKWDMLPDSWRHDFALVFLFYNVQDKLPVYQYFAGALRDGAKDGYIDQLEDFLPFLESLLGFIKASLTWDQLTSVGNWLVQLPEIFEHQDAHNHIKNILSSRKQYLLEAPSSFAEPLMADPGMNE